MSLPRVQFSVRWMLVVVAVAGVSLAAFRIHPALGVFVAGVSSLALVRVFGAVERRKAESQQTGSAELVRTSIVSLLIALVILVASCVPGFFIFPLTNATRMHETPRVTAVGLVGIGISGLLGIPIASFLRRRPW